MPTDGRRAGDGDRVMTREDIAWAARSILAESGVEGVTVRAVARRVGVSAPAFYRHYDSRESLLRHIAAEICRARTEGLAAAAEHGFIAVAKCYRNWAVGSRHEYVLLFARGVAEDAARRFASVLTAPLARLWRARPFPAPADAEIGLELRGQLARHRDWLADPDLPIGVVLVLLTSWIRVHSLVAMEAAHPAGGGQRFAREIADIAACLGAG